MFLRMVLDRFLHFVIKSKMAFLLADCKLRQHGSTKTQEKFDSSFQVFKKCIQECFGNFTKFSGSVMLI